MAYLLSNEVEKWVATRIATAWIDYIDATQRYTPKQYALIKAAGHWDGTARLAASMGLAGTESGVTMDMLDHVLGWEGHIPAPFTKDRRIFHDQAVATTHKIFFEQA